MDALESIHEERYAVFDEIIKSIESMLKAKPDVYRDYMRVKKELDRVRENRILKVKQMISRYSDDINKTIDEAASIADIKYMYRRNLIDAIIEIITKHGMMHFIFPEFATLEPA